MVVTESIPFVFSCNDDLLVGILEKPASPTKRAIVIVVGGPQYRVGSHRQFTLLSRALASAGVTTLRFDHRGIGDSDGHTTFDRMDLDISCAIDALILQEPGVNEIVILALCDGASAALIYAHSDPRVLGLVLLNPWVRSEHTLAQSYFRTYYLAQLTSREFWGKLFSGKIELLKSLQALLCNLRLAIVSPTSSAPTEVSESLGEGDETFQVRMMEGLCRFPGEILLILSGNDLTADEFQAYSASNRRWRRKLARRQVQRRHLSDANHTFSRKAWRIQVETWVIEWIKSW
jgi:exosortase A-associated hydrolase 1